jgi:sn-glycerol 3-phosphate transport system permease protein
MKKIYYSRARQGLAHLLLIMSTAIVCMPLYFAFVAASHDTMSMMQIPLPSFPGHSLMDNLFSVWSGGIGGISCGRLLWNSFCMAMTVAIGKLVLALLCAFAMVYFYIPGQRLIMIILTMTLVLPIELRLIPTYELVVQFHGLNTLWGLTLPLMVSATAVMVLKNHLLKLPSHLVDAAKLDGAGPRRFFFDMMLPLSKAPLSSLFVILFIYGWNQYLWPLVMTTQADTGTIVMGMRYLSGAADLVPEWNLMMSVVLIALGPPCMVLLTMQQAFERGMN